MLKDPDERQDYTVDWATDGYLAAGETVSSSTWTLPTGISQFGVATIGTPPTTATIWLSGGTHGEEYVVSNKITTSNGRIAERSIKILCRNR